MTFQLSILKSSMLLVEAFYLFILYILIYFLLFCFQVVVRMRPARTDKEEEDTIVQKLSTDSLAINGQTFTFDSVADTEASQARAYWT